MQIDSTPLDVLVRLDNGVPDRVDLTGIIDVATRTVTAAVLRPTTRSVDASVLLARTVTPEPMRPGWPEAMKMSASALPFRRMLSIDERLEHAAARPVIIPQVIVVDHGKVFVSESFKASCAFLGISLQPARKATGTDKPHIERTLGSVATMFAQYVSGYTGRSPEYRGRGIEKNAVWSLPELQDLLDQWLIADELHNLDMGTRAGAEASDTLKYFSERLPVTFVFSALANGRADLRESEISLEPCRVSGWLERWLVAVSVSGDGLGLEVGVAEVGSGRVLPCADVVIAGMGMAAAVFQQPVHGGARDDEAGAADVLLDHHEQLGGAGGGDGPEEGRWRMLPVQPASARASARASAARSAQAVLLAGSSAIHRGSGMRPSKKSMGWVSA